MHLYRWVSVYLVSEHEPRCMVSKTQLQHSYSRDKWFWDWLRFERVVFGSWPLHELRDLVR